MKRIDTEHRAIDLHGPGKDGWRDGATAPTLPVTRGNADFFNTIQEELCSPIEGMDYALDGGRYDQLFASIRASLRMFPVVSSLALRASESTHFVDTLDDVAFIPLGGSFGLGIFIAVGQASDDPLLPDAAVWRSYDGINWIKASPMAAWLRAVAASPTRIIVAGHRTQSNAPVVQWSTLAGETFENVELDALGAIATNGNSIASLAYDSVHSTFIAVGKRSAAGLMLMYSDDDGDAWKLTMPDASYAGEFNKVLNIGARSIAFGTLAEVQTSDDGGATWTRRHNQPALQTITSVVAGTGVILCNTAQARTMLRSVDNGVTWTETYSPEVLEAAGIDDAVIEHVGRFDRMLLAVCKDATSGRRYIIGSLDKGATWKYAVRMPAVDAAGAKAATITGMAHDGQRLVAIGRIDAVTGPSAVAFCSALGATGDIA